MELLAIIAFAGVVGLLVGGLMWWLSTADVKDLEDMQ